MKEIEPPETEEPKVVAPGRKKKPEAVAVPPTVPVPVPTEAIGYPIPVAPPGRKEKVPLKPPIPLRPGEDPPAPLWPPPYYPPGVPKPIRIPRPLRPAANEPTRPPNRKKQKVKVRNPVKQPVHALSEMLNESARVAEAKGEAISVQQQLDRSRIELGNLERSVQSVTATYLPVYRSGSGPGGAGGGEAISTAYAEEALAEAYRRRQLSGSSGSKRTVKGGTSPGGEDAAPSPPVNYPRPSHEPGSEPSEPSVHQPKTGGKKQPTRAQVLTAAGITAAVIGAGEVIRRSGRGGGSPWSPSRPAFGYKFVKDTRKYQTALAQNLRNRRSKN